MRTQDVVDVVGTQRVGYLVRSLKRDVRDSLETVMKDVHKMRVTELT